mmetsp:Transcript_12780/g.23978  ORF Transcript_12780/g.23978 Transcript_12780/m.23978 type:complete len:97 (+) Transcript_12780:160-450(+)
MYKSADHKKEEYKRYLEKSGVTDALTKVMVSLYEEPDRPSNAIEYIRKYLGTNAGGGGSSEYDLVKKENEELKKKMKELETQIGDLRRELSKGNDL